MTEASLTAVPAVEAQPKPPTNSIFRHAIYVVADNPVTGLSFGLFVLIAVCALIGPYIVPYDPLASDTSATLQSPSLHHGSALIYWAAIFSAACWRRPVSTSRLQSRRSRWCCSWAG